MKKTIIFFILAIIGTYQSYAVTLCVRNNTYVDILKKNVAGLTGESSNDGKKWKIDFGYKTVTGIAACNEISGTNGVALTNLFTSATDQGEQCWCKIEPVLAYGFETGITSYWVFLNTYADAATCATSCAAACMNAIKSDTAFRSAVFEAVW